MVNEIICIGDSITGWNNLSRNPYDWPVPTYPRYLDELVKNAKKTREVINAGFNGARSNELPRIFSEYELSYPQSEYIIMQFGTNDFHAEGFRPQISNRICSYLSSGIKISKHLNKIPIIINQHRISSEASSIARIEKHNAHLAAECRRWKIPCVDIYSRIRDHNLRDNFHPNGGGARLIAEEVYRVLMQTAG